MKITANPEWIEVEGRRENIRDGGTVKIKELRGRAVRLVLLWSGTAWDISVAPVHSVPVLPVVLPPEPWGREVVIEVGAAPGASAKIRRHARPNPLRHLDGLTGKQLADLARDLDAWIDDKRIDAEQIDREAGYPKMAAWRKIVAFLEAEAHARK